MTENQQRDLTVKNQSENSFFEKNNSFAKIYRLWQIVPVTAQFAPWRQF